MKKTESTGFTSLVSMLSILFAFVIVCALCVTLLVRLGVMNIDWLSPASSTGEPLTPTAQSESGVSGEIGEVTLDETSVRRVLSELPFFDNFYAKIYATYIGSGPDGIFRTEAYDVYRSGDKYKIVSYDNSSRKTIVCDGKQVMIRDEIEGIENVFPVTDDYSFSAQSPIPDFSIFKSGRYEVDKYYISGSDYVFYCTFSDLGITDEVRVSADSGIVTLFRSNKDGKLFYDYSLFTFETDRTFDEGEFSISH